MSYNLNYREMYIEGMTCIHALAQSGQIEILKMTNECAKLTM